MKIFGEHNPIITEIKPEIASANDSFKLAITCVLNSWENRSRKLKNLGNYRVATLPNTIEEVLNNTLLIQKISQCLDRKNIGVNEFEEIQISHKAKSFNDDTLSLTIPWLSIKDILDQGVE